jgi:hypothetical protein
VRRGTGGCAGGEYVVNEQNVFRINGFWIRYCEGAADIRAAGMRSEPRLAFGGAVPHQGAVRQRQPPPRMGFTKKTKCIFG